MCKKRLCQNSYDNHTVCAERLISMSVHLSLWTRTKNANFDTAFFCTLNVQFLRVLLFAHLFCAPALFFGHSVANFSNAFTLQTFGMPIYAILKKAC